MRIIHPLFFFLLAGAFLSIAAAPVIAQPQGWPCDYGLRPGNVWYYRMVSRQGRIYRDSIARDSIGADGSYWVYLYTVPEEKYGHWYRMDSSCTLYRYHYQPREIPDETMFRAAADSGDWWTVYTDPYTVVAQVNMVYSSTIFGRPSEIREVVYYLGEVGQGWFQAAEYASGIGVIRYRWHPSGLDEIIGAVIDGKRYGTTSAVDDTSSGVDSRHLDVFPMPASTNTSLQFFTQGERTAGITVHDVLGRTVHHRSLSELKDGINTIHLDVSTLAAGTYRIALDINGARHTAPLIIAR